MKYEMNWDLDEPRYDDPDSPNKIDLGVYYDSTSFIPRYDLGAYHNDAEPNNAYLWVRYGDEPDDVHGRHWSLAIRFIIDGKKYDHTDSAMAVCIERFVYTLLHDIKWHTDEVKFLDDAAESD